MGRNGAPLPCERRRTLAWVAGFLPPRLRPLSAVLALSVVSTIAGLAQPMLTKALIDHALPDRRMDLVLGLCGALFGLSAFASALGYLTRVLYVRVSGDFLFALREALFAHLMTLSPRWFAQAREGDVFSRLDGDITEVQRFALDGALAAVGAVISLVGAVVAMASLSLPLTLLSLVVLPVQVAAVATLRPRIERGARHLRGRAADLGAFFFETLPAARHIQVCQAEQHESQRLSRLNSLYLDELLRQERLTFLAGAIPSLLMSATTALIFVFGAASVLGEALSIGAMVAFVSYLGRAAAPLQSFLGLWVASKRAVVSLDRLAELRALRPELRHHDTPLPLPHPLRGALSLRGVTLNHGSHPVFANLSCELPAGARIAVVGPSGCGKSSLCDLLVRLYDPDGGAILLDGVPLERVAPAELRRAVALVSQEVVLLPGSIADNVAYGLADAGSAEVAAALAAAGLGDTLAALPLGADTPVGANGRRLSGGQRQRVAIARAILAKPQVLILDEVTTGLDPELRREVLDTIDRHFAHCTRLVVSHDPQVVAGCDCLLDLPAGTVRPVTEIGP